MPGIQAGASAVNLERPARGKAQWSHPTLSITWDDSQHDHSQEGHLGFGDIWL